MYSPPRAEIKINDRAYKMRGLRRGRSEVIRNVKRYLQTKSRRENIAQLIAWRKVVRKEEALDYDL